VVVAVIALLIAVLLPALARVRAQARSAVCASHERQFGVAANLFAAEHKGRVPRGLSRHGSTTLSQPPNWIRMVARMLGDRTSYGPNFNKVPVEKYEVYSCPERSREYGAIFLDYVVNSTDHRGPIRLSDCSSQPTTGSWYEVEGVTKIEIWKRPSSVIYVTDAVQESWKIDDLGRSLEGIRVNIDSIRSQPPLSVTGFDWFDVPGGRGFPTYPDYTYDGKVSTQRYPRAALDMHLGKGSNGVFVDGHVELVKPPPASAHPQEIHEFYMRQFGVEPQYIPGSTAVSTTAALHSCTAGDVDWRP